MAKQFGILRQKIRFAFRLRGKILYALAVSSPALLVSILPHVVFSQRVQMSKLEISAGTPYN